MKSETKKFFVYLDLLPYLPRFHYANHKITRAQGDELGDFLPPWVKETFHSDVEFEAQQFLPMWEWRLLVESLDSGKSIWTHTGLIQISWKLGSPRFSNCYTKFSPNPFSPSSYLVQRTSPADASGGCWNGFATGRLGHLLTS